MNPLGVHPDIYLHGRGLALDLETTVADNGWGPSAIHSGNEIVLACWETHEGVSKHAWTEDGFDELLQDVYSHDFIIAHHAKFELQWLKRLGVNLRKILCFDTMVAEWVLNAGRFLPNGFLKLSETLKRHNLTLKYDWIAPLWEAGIDTRDIPRSLLLPYCRRDKNGCKILYQKQVVLLSEEVG